MKILAIETSLFQCSVALLHKGSISSLQIEEHAKQSSYLFPLIQTLVEPHHLSMKNMDVMVCTIGPGSFTGVRIGIAAVRATTQVLPHIKALGISTLEMVAFQQKNKINDFLNVIVATIDAGQGQSYVQKFTSCFKPLTEVILASEDSIHTQLQPNEIIASYKNHPINAEHVLARAIELLQLNIYGSMEKNDSKLSFFNKLTSHSSLQPLYVKQPSITMPSNTKPRF